MGIVLGIFTRDFILVPTLYGMLVPTLVYRKNIYTRV